MVYSDEEPAEKLGKTENFVKKDPDKPRKDTPASLAFVPSVVGLIIAGEVVKRRSRAAIKTSIAVFV